MSNPTETDNQTHTTQPSAGDGNRQVCINEVTPRASVADDHATSPQAVMDDKTAQKPQSVLKQQVRLDLIVDCLKRNKRKYVLPMVIVVALTALYIYSLPRYYTASVMLAPESSGGGSRLGDLGGLSSMMGIDLSSSGSEDAIAPMFYPDLMKSTDFTVPLLGVNVQTSDGKFKGNYADYLTKACKAPWWVALMLKAKQRLNSKKGQDAGVQAGAGQTAINPFRMTKKQDELVRGVVGNIACSVDKTTQVITITTTAQDPLVAALMADTIMARLQDFIIDYRTKKAKNDLNHYRQLLAKAEANYKAKQKAYAAFADANQDVVLATYRVKEDALENELQMAFNAYSSMKNQVVAAEAKLMERTPAFTTIQNASVPIRPAGPKRMMTIAAMMFVCFVLTSARIIIRDKTLKF